MYPKYNIQSLYHADHFKCGINVIGDCVNILKHTFKHENKHYYDFKNTHIKFILTKSKISYRNHYESLFGDIHIK